jgi:hypothetical protein
MNGASVAALSAFPTPKQKMLSIIGKAMSVFIAERGTSSQKTRPCRSNNSRSVKRQRSAMFVRRKQDWRQEYFYLVSTVRDGAKVRQRSVYLGKTLNLSAEQWGDVLHKLEEQRIDFLFRSPTEAARQAVRAYCKRQGLPLKTAEAVRDGARLNRKLDEEEARRREEKYQAARDRARREKGEREARNAGHYNSFSRSATVLGVSPGATKEEVQTAFRQQARVHHPDHGGDPSKFRAVVEARDAMLRNLGTTA